MFFFENLIPTPFAPFLNYNVRFCFELLFSLLAFRVVGGFRKVGTKPILAQVFVWILFVWTVLAIDRWVPSQAILFSEIRVAATVVIGFFLAWIGAKRISRWPRLERIHPIFFILVTWFLMGEILGMHEATLNLFLLGPLNHAQIRWIEVASEFLLIGIGIWIVLVGRPPASESTEPGIPLGRDNNLQMLRIILATGVLIHHCCYFASLHHKWVDKWDMGWVASFLCLAGVLIPQSRASSKDSLLRVFGRDIKVGGPWVFAAKRFLRVYPAMLFGFALCFAYFGLSYLIVFVKGSYLIGTIGGFGTITVEELCYITLMIFWAVGAYRKTWVLWLFLAITAVGAYAAMYLSLNPGVVHRLHISGEIGENYAYFASFPQFFFVGNLLRVYDKKLRSIPVWIYAVVFAATFLPWGADNIAFHQLEVLIRVACLYAAFAFSKPYFSWIQKYGDPSYSLFLYHFFLLQVLTSTYKLNFWPLFAIAYPISVLIAYASWFAIEKPMLDLKEKFVPIKSDGHKQSSSSLDPLPQKVSTA